ncbi:MAG TPA: hypothetical protein VK636_08375 [Gemmatimonadaceae bacterium]|nr:hypothetical protein [Gemmatimonadaceae bacterium]
MNSRRLGRVHRPMVSAAESVHRFGPWPWYLEAADFIGLDVDVVDDIAGDLVEECAGLSGPTDIVRRAWCVGQAFRALPYLAISTLRRGHPRARLRLLGAMGALLAVAASVVAVPQFRVGPPALITADRGFDAKDIVINNVDVVQMPIRALDAHGHTVTNAGIRYERVSGDRIDILQTGAVSCRTRGDAVVRASLNDLASLATVHCRPVTGIRTMAWHDFLPGDQPQSLRVDIVDADGSIVKELRGSVRVSDTSVATLHRGLLTPRDVGSSRLTIAVGDAHVNVAVNVHEIVDRFDNLAPTQRNVAMRLHLARDDTLRLPVPAGTLWVKWMSRGGAATHPAITAEGPGYCHVDTEAITHWLPAGEYGAYCYVSDGARIRVAGGGAGDSVLTGALLLERMSR